MLIVLMVDLSFCSFCVAFDPMAREQRFARRKIGSRHATWGAARAAKVIRVTLLRIHGGRVP
jgi:hypothetical protein